MVFKQKIDFENVTTKSSSYTLNWVAYIKTSSTSGYCEMAYYTNTYVRATVGTLCSDAQIADEFCCIKEGN